MEDRVEKDRQSTANFEAFKPLSSKLSFEEGNISEIFAGLLCKVELCLQNRIKLILDAVAHDLWKNFSSAFAMFFPAMTAVCPWTVSFVFFSLTRTALVSYHMLGIPVDSFDTMIYWSQVKSLIIYFLDEEISQKLLKKYSVHNNNYKNFVRQKSIAYISIFQENMF